MRAEAHVREKAKAKLDKAMEAVREAARKLKDEPDEPAGAEDAFVLPPDEPKREEPPKDPNPPSGSLSSDDDEEIPVNLAPAPPPGSRP
jgi:hypothetical protein